MMKRFYSIALCFGCLVTGCNSSEEKVSGEPVAIMRFDREAYHYNMLDENDRNRIDSVFSPIVGLMSSVYGVDSVGFISYYGASRAVEIFSPDVERRFLAEDSVAAEFGNVRARYAMIFPADTFPTRFYGVINPFNQGIILSDSLVMIGLNHYLGADYEGYAQFEEYRRRQKTIKRLVPDVAEALVAVRHPYQESAESTVLSRLLYEGALVDAVIQLADISPEEALGYTEAEYNWAQVNESKVWQALAANRLLYSTNPNDADRLVGPMPATTVINQNAPGRIGRYMGWRIIQSYKHNNPSTSVVKMLEPDFYNATGTLVDSKYAPQ